MRNYESEMEHASAASGEKASGKELLGEMHEIYYGNRFTIDWIERNDKEYKTEIGKWS